MAEKELPRNRNEERSQALEHPGPGTWAVLEQSLLTLELS